MGVLPTTLILPHKGGGQSHQVSWLQRSYATAPQV